MLEAIILKIGIAIAFLLNLKTAIIITIAALETLKYILTAISA